MRFADVFTTALTQIRANKLRSFFTLLGIIVSVAFLVAVVAVIQGMNAYVKENIADALIGSNTFQVRRLPINLGLIEDADWLRMQRRPKITAADADVVRAALPDAGAISRAVRVSRRRAATSSGATRRSAPCRCTASRRTYQQHSGLSIRVRRSADARSTSASAGSSPSSAPTSPTSCSTDAIRSGRSIHVHGIPVTIVGTIAAKGRVLGQSFDGFVMLPITTFESLYGRRQTTTISVKMNDAAERRAGDGARRGGDARRASPAPGRGRQLLRRDGRRARRLLEAADAACCSRSFRRWSRSASSSAAS